jgi:ribosomal protein S8
LFDVRTLAELTARGVLADRFAVTYAKQLGFEEGEFTGYVEASRRFPDYATIIDLYLRGFIDEETAKRWLRRLGFSLEVVEAVFKLKDALPSTSDLITMVVREAFVPEMVVEAPEIFAKYMKMRGFSKEWSDRYWTAHFRPIPIEYAYDNVRRGLRDFDWLRKVLYIHDIHPNYIEDIVNVIYNPPSLRELGYGFDVGVYTLDDIKKYRMWAGLSPKDAEKAAQAMVAYRTEAERNAVRTELMYAYGQGRITREEFEKRLRELNTPEAAVEYWLLRGDLYKERISWEPPQTESRSITRADAIWAFVHGLRDESWLRDVLKKIGYSDDAVELYVAVAKQRLAEEQKPPEEPQPRRLTLSQIKTAYIAGLITKDEAVRRIKAMGFTEQDANLVLEVMLYEPVSEPKIKPFTRGDVSSFYRYGLWDEEDVFNAFKEMGYDDAHAGLLTMLEVLDDMYPKLKMLYEKGYIDDQELLRKFIDLGLSPSDAQNVVNRLMFELSMERIKEERALTKSEIIKGVKNGVFSFEDGVQMLKDLGYSDAEARYILVINGIVAAGDPMGYWEMRRAVELMKKAQGKPYIEIPDEVIMQERLIEEQKRKIEEMKARGEKEEVIAAEMGVLAQMEATFRKLLKKYNLVPG